MTATKLTIKAKWTQYGPSYYQGTKRLDIVSNVNTWELAAFDLLSWLDRIEFTGEVEFVGPSAESAKQGFDYARL